MRYLKSFIKYFLYFYIALTITIWVVTPFVANYFIKPILADYNLTLNDGTTIRYNLLTSTVTVRDLSVNAKMSEQSYESFAVDVLDFELHLHQLLFKNIYIADFSINGFRLNVEKKQDDILIAGVSLKSLENNKKEPEVNEEVKEQPESYFVERLILPEFILENSKISILLDGHQHSTSFNSLKLEDIEADLTNQKVLISLDSLLNEAELITDADIKVVDGDVNIALDLALQNFDLSKFRHLLPDNIQHLSGNVNYNAKHLITLYKEGVDLKILNLNFNTEGIAITQNQQAFSIAKQTLKSESLDIIYGFDGDIKIAGNAYFTLFDFAIQHAKTTKNVLNVHNVELDDIKLSTVNSVPKIAITELTIVDLLLFNNEEENLPAIVNLAKFTSNDLSFSQESAAINSIALSGLSVDVFIDKEKQILNLVSLSEKTDVAIEKAREAEPTSEQDNTEPEQKITETNAFAIKFGQLTLLEPASINFVDNSVSPKFEQNITLTELSVGALNSELPDTVTPAKLVANSKQYLAIDLALAAKPFAQTPNYYLKGFVNELNLPPISSYIKDALKYEIQSGQLDLAIDTNITGTELGGDIDVLLRQIELTKADDHEANTIGDTTSVPFNIALGMLKNGDGDVELSLPLSGDVSSPDFGFSGLITLLVKQATISAAKDYLVNTFVPYASVVKIAVAAGEYALKINFNDLEYQAGMAKMTPEQNEYLEQFAAVMKKETSLSVKLCPISTPQDVKLPLGQKITDKSIIEKLHQLSRERAELFKDFMVKEKEIKSSQLLLCTPQIDFGEEAKPVIKFVT